MVPIIADNVWADGPSWAHTLHKSVLKIGPSERTGSVLALWLKEGINMHPADPCYGFFQEALELARLRPVVAFCFADATINQVAGKHVRYVGRFERIAFDQNLPDGCGELDKEVVHLPQIVVRVGRRLEVFRDCLSEAVGQAVSRLERREAVRPMVGFTGLADALLLLMRTHHGWSQEAQAVGLVIVDLLRQTLEGLAPNGRRYGLLSLVEPRRFSWWGPGCRYGFEAWGVSDPFEKIAAEAPFHRYCDGGHVTIVRWDRRRPVRDLEELLLYAREQDAGCVWPC
jgi:ribonucleoside-triphosphate reductase